MIGESYREVYRSCGGKLPSCGFFVLCETASKFMGREGRVEGLRKQTYLLKS